jgi:hypothetical protein
MTFLGLIENEGLRTVVGSCMFVGGVFCMWGCVYKYTVCQENNKKIRVHETDPPPPLGTLVYGNIPAHH